MKKIYILFAALFLLASCGDVGKILRNEKMRTTDEFLVKKKEPLVLPPNYEEIPEPDTIVKKKNNSDNKIKDILKARKKKNSISSKSQSVEKSILEKIK